MRRSSDNRSQRGFSLLELLVVMVILIIVLTLAVQLLFAMHRSAAQQRLQVEARQTARGAVDYVTHLLRTVYDANVPEGTAPGLLFQATIRGTAIQTGHDNVTDAALADVGTDIITIAVPSQVAAVAPARWPGGDQNSANPWWGFGLGCDGTANQDERNLALFKQMIAWQEPNGPSRELMLVDETGNWDWYQICEFVSVGSDCSGGNPCNNTPCVKVQSNPGCGDNVVLPAGYPHLSNPRLVLGLQHISLRVREGWLEQKQGIFRPAVDNPGPNFVRLLPNIEDLQFAYFFDDGTVWNNTPARTLATTGAVPTHGAGAWTDAGNIKAIRVSVVARAAGVAAGDFTARFTRPESENRPAGTAADQVYRYQASALAMLRNRVPGS